MGFRLAEAARDRGARVILISGPSSEADPPRVEVTRVMTAAEMRDAVLDRLQDAGVIIMAAAVADYRPEVVETSKIKKGEGTLELKLTRTDDILLEIGRRRSPEQTVVGFAAESDELEARARKKLGEKKLDLVVGNLVGKEGTGLGADSNEVLLIGRDGEAEAVPVMSKRKVAEKILDRIEVLLGRD
jgi:phosphopantothenoylcysteine decarboxylase/phosphopantothenate--cysteine ligase